MFFACCENLHTVTFAPDSELEIIGLYAFYYCMKLREITLPDTLREICDYAFGDCVLITELNLSEGLRKIGVGAFYNTAITTLHIPSTLLQIGSDFTAECKSLASFTGTDGNPCMKVYDDVLYICSDWQWTVRFGAESPNFQSETATWGLFRYPPQKTDAEYTVWEGADEITEYCGLENNDYLQVLHLNDCQMNPKSIAANVTISETKLLQSPSCRNRHISQLKVWMKTNR